MKTLIVVAVLLGNLFGYGAIRAESPRSEYKVEIDTLQNDSLEYKLLVLEPGFETYLMTQTPKEFYTKAYYHSWNTRYAVEYNNQYRNVGNREVFQEEINFDPFIDYGLEVEYQLYHYFNFFEGKYKITLIKRGR